MGTSPDWCNSPFFPGNLVLRTLSSLQFTTLLKLYFALFPAALTGSVLNLSGPSSFFLLEVIDCMSVDPFCCSASPLNAFSVLHSFSTITITTTVCTTQNPEATVALLSLSLFYFAQCPRQRWHPVIVKEHFLSAGLSHVHRSMQMPVWWFADLTVIMVTTHIMSLLFIFFSSLCCLLKSNISIVLMLISPVFFINPGIQLTFSKSTWMIIWVIITRFLV